MSPLQPAPAGIWKLDGATTIEAAFGGGAVAVGPVLLQAASASAAAIARNADLISSLRMRIDLSRDRGPRRGARSMPCAPPRKRFRQQRADRSLIIKSQSDRQRHYLLRIGWRQPMRRR